MDRELERAERDLNQSLQKSQILTEQQVLRSASHSIRFVRKMEQKHEREREYQKNVALTRFKFASKFDQEPETRQKLEEASNNLERLSRQYQRTVEDGRLLSRKLANEQYVEPSEEAKRFVQIAQDHFDYYQNVPEYTIQSQNVGFRQFNL